MGATLHGRAAAPKPASASVSPAPLGEGDAGAKRQRWNLGDRLAIAVAALMGLFSSAALAVATTAVVRSN